VIPRVRPLPPRRLADLEPAGALLETGSLGYLDAAPEDRRRWVAGFRALLDGLDGPLQVLIDFIPGRQGPPQAAPPPAAAPPAAPPARSQALPAPDRRRQADVEFAGHLRETPPAQRRQVRFATSAAAADPLARALDLMGVPDVHPVDWEPCPGLAFGVEQPSMLHDGAGWHRTWFVDRYPGGELEPGWLLRLVPRDLRLTLGWHAERLPAAWVVDYLQRQLATMRASQLQRGEAGSADPTLDGAVPAAERLQRELISSQENAFFVSLYLTATTGSREAMRDASSRVEAAARSVLCTLLPCDFRHLDGRLATLPLGRDPLGRRRVLHTSALATLMPWFDADLQQSAGLVVGRSRATGQPVVVDPFDDSRFANANMGIFGHSGAGKTYLLSTVAMSALSLGAQVFVVDPEHEYGALARLLGGLDIPLGLGSGHSLNVLDLRGAMCGVEAGVGVDEAVLGAAIADAVDLCAVICGGLDEAERAALEAVVRRTLEDVESPLLGDVAAALDPGSRMHAVLSRWVRGSLGRIFSRPTSIDLDAPLIVFGMRELRPELVAPVHYLLAEALWARIKRRDRRRLLVVDELGLLFEDATIRQFVVGLARRIRKYDGALVFATQNPGDLLSSEAGAVVATNPALHFFGAQRPGEAEKLQRAFNLSDAQRTALEVARRGDFLLTAAGDRLPVRVQAPAWQAAAMRQARAPPRNRP
jgi:Helicase HerA, central domain